DAVLRLRLRGMKRMNGIGVVVAEHAGGPRRLTPTLALQLPDEMPIPVLDLFRGTAPVAIAHMQDMVLEVLELVVRRLRALHVGSGMLEEQAVPSFRIGDRQLLQRIERKFVMRAARMSRGDNLAYQAHGPAILRLRKRAPGRAT